MFCCRAVTKAHAAVLVVVVIIAVVAVGTFYTTSCLAAECPSTVITTGVATKQKLSLDHVTVIGTQPLPLASVVYGPMLASKLGFYDKYGLTVDPIGTSGAVEALGALAGGKGEFSDMSVGVGIPARGNGTALRYIFMLQQRDPEVVYALEKSGIKTPKDLEGKTMAVSFGSAEYATMALFGKTAGFDYTKVKYINTSPSQYLTLLLSGQADFAMQFLTNYYNYEAALAKQGQKLVVIFRYDYFDVYGTGMVTTDSFIRHHADVVKVFTEGYAYGLQYMINNPKNASVLLAGMMKGADQESVYNIARTFSAFKSSRPRQSGQPYGIMDDKTWNATINLMVDYLGAKRVAPKDIYTNDYVPTQYIPTAQVVSPIMTFYDNLYALPYENLDNPTSLPGVTGSSLLRFVPE